MNNFLFSSHINSGEQFMTFFKKDDTTSCDELRSIIFQKDKLIRQQVRDISCLKNEIKSLKNELDCFLNEEK